LARTTFGVFVIPLSALWLPILLSAVALFFVSSVIHMMSPWHKTDYPALPNEGALGDAVALYQMSIWHHRKWSTTFKMTLDGLIYAVVTLLIFGALWPR
jgi:hypothetical protein